MAEILGVIASAFTIADTIKIIGKCIKTVHDVRNAPCQLSRMVEEASAMQETLTQIASVSDSLASEPHDSGQILQRWILVSLRRQIEKIDEKLLAFDELCQRCIKQSVHGGFEMIRFRWLYYRREAIEILESVENLRNELNTSLCVLKLSSMAALHVEVRNIAGSQSQALQILSDMQKQMIISKSLSPRIFLDDKVSQEAQSSGCQIHTLDRFSFPERSSRLDEEHKSLGPLKLARLDDSSVEPCCARWCSCDCHSRYRLVIPLAIGFLQASFRGISLKRTCSENNCRRPSSTAVKMTFNFHSSVWNRFVYFSLRYTPLCGPEINIRLPRIVDAWSSKLWTHSLVGNVEGIQKLFANGEASPWDVNLYGASALHYAVDHRFWRLCRFLIEQGADTLLEDRNATTPASIAWELILTNQLEMNEADDLALIFRGADYIESMRLTNLHKAILRVAPVSVDALLLCSTSDINAQDGAGRTPLSWAVARDDLDSTRSLLKNRADPDIGDNRGFRPAHYARSLFCIQILVQHGANLMARTDMGATPLHFASRDGFSDMIEWMYGAGADLDAMERSGTPLICSTYDRQPRSTAILLRLGADINAATPESSSTAMHFAIFHNVHDILEQLLDNNADYTRCNIEGQTMIHFAARAGDDQTMQILARHGLRGLDVEARDNKLMTAQDCFEQRASDTKSREIISSFRAMISGISGRIGPELPHL